MAKDILGIEVFAVGTWNYMKFVSEDLEAIAKNTNKLFEDNEHKPPLKAGHDDYQTLLDGQYDGDPALGWIENLRVEDDKLLADLIGVPDIVVEAIEKKLYRTVSVELDYIRHFGWILTAVALLGADLPAVKDIKDLEAYLSELPTGKPDGNIGSLAFSAPIFLKGKENMDKEQDKNTPTPNSGGGTVPTVQVFTQDAKAQTEIERLQRELAEAQKLQAENDRLQTENASFKQAAQENKFNDRKDTILTTYKADAQAGKLPPAVLAKLEAHIVEQKQSFMDGREVSISPEMALEVARSYSNSLPQGEHADSNAGNQNESGEFDGDVEMEKAVFEMQAKYPSKSYSECSKMVMHQNPALLKTYNDMRTRVSDSGRLN